MYMHNEQDSEQEFVKVATADAISIKHMIF